MGKAKQQRYRNVTIIIHNDIPEIHDSVIKANIGMFLALKSAFDTFHPLNNPCANIYNILVTETDQIIAQVSGEEAQSSN